MTTMDGKTRIQFEKTLDELANGLDKEVDSIARDCAQVFNAPRPGARDEDKDKDRQADGRAQMNNLERAGFTSRRFGDVVAFVKRQTGKDKRWQMQANGAMLGVRVVELLEKVKKAADEKTPDAAESKDGAPAVSATLSPYRNELRLRLAALCLRNLNSGYLFNTVAGK